MGHYASEMAGDITPEQAKLNARVAKVQNKLQQVTLAKFKASDLPLLMRFMEGKNRLGDLEELEKLLSKKRKPGA